MKKQKSTLTKEQLEELIANFDPMKDPIMKKVIELGKDKHMSFSDAMKFIENQ